MITKWEDEAKVLSRHNHEKKRYVKNLTRRRLEKKVRKSFPSISLLAYYWLYKKLKNSLKIRAFFMTLYVIL